MKTFFFHLMPYADLDLSYTDRYNSAWVTLPNSYFDPKVGEKLYQRYIGELELADQLGFDGICVNEHHQTAYGLMPAPNLIAAALARTTKQAKIAILGRALPLVSNPVALAEEFAMLDQLSGGRIITGFVRGIGTEYFASGVNPTFSHERYYEAHELILRAWTETGPFRYHGKHYQFDYVNLWPRPLQQPHPPVWIPSQGSSETVEWCASAKRKYTYLQTFSPIKSAQKAFDLYRQVAEREGYESHAVAARLGDPDLRRRDRRDRAPRAQAAYRGVLQQVPALSARDAHAARLFVDRLDQGADREQVRLPHDGDEGREPASTSAWWWPAARPPCASSSRSYSRELGVGNLIAMLQVATLPADLTEKNLRLFASDVMPYLRGEEPRPARQPGNGAGAIVQSARTIGDIEVTAHQRRRAADVARRGAQARPRPRRNGLSGKKVGDPVHIVGQRLPAQDERQVRAGRHRLRQHHGADARHGCPRTCARPASRRSRSTRSSSLTCIPIIRTDWSTTRATRSFPTPRSSCTSRRRASGSIATRPAPPTSASAATSPRPGVTTAPYRARMRTVGDGEAVPGVSAILQAGHTPGHTGWLLQSGNESLLIWGDLVHLAAIQIPRPDTGLVYDVDPQMAGATRLRMFDRIAADRTAGRRRAPGFSRLRLRDPQRRRLSLRSRRLTSATRLQRRGATLLMRGSVAA